MQPIHKQKKKKEEKGFDLLQAKFLDQGLVASGDTRSLGLRAVAQTHSHSERHQEKKVKKHENKFKSEVKREHAKAVDMRRTHLSKITPVRKQTHKPRQLKDDKENPESEKPDSSEKDE